MTHCPHCTRKGIVNNYDRYACIYCGYEDYGAPEVPFVDMVTPHAMKSTVIKYGYTGTRKHYKDTRFTTTWRRAKDGKAILMGACPIDQLHMEMQRGYHSTYRTRNGEWPSRKISFVDYHPRGFIVTANGHLSDTMTYRNPRVRPWTVREFLCKEGHVVYLDVNKGWGWQTDVEIVQV